MLSIRVNDDQEIRTYTVADVEALYQAIDESRQRLRTWFDWVDRTNTPEFSLHFIQQSIHNLQEQRALALGIFIGGVLAGEIGMHYWDKEVKLAHIGYWLRTGYERRGIMHESLRHFISFLFERLDLNKVEIRFIPSNKRSACVAERLGFRIEGLIRQSVLHNGRLEDVLIAGMLKGEWPHRLAPTTSKG